MESISLELDRYNVSLQLPFGLDVDKVTVLSHAPELNRLERQGIIDKLAALGCVEISVSNR